MKEPGLETGKDDSGFRDETAAPMDFSRVPLAVGEAVQLACVSPQRRWPLQYLGALPGQSLLLSLPSRQGRPVRLAEDTPVTLRFVAGDYACGCTSRVQKAQLTPWPLLYLDYPRALEVKRIRSDTRVRTRLIVSVDGGEDPALGGVWPRQALLSDLSLRGARLEASDLLAGRGERLYLRVRLPVADFDQLVLLETRVRSLEEEALGERLRVTHGLQLLDPDEETRLVLVAFIYQQLLRERFAL